MSEFTEEMVLAVFSKFLPDDVLVIPLDHDLYIEEAKKHPFIRTQIDQGIYDEDTFSEEFLSVARSYSPERVIEVDMYLILKHMEGVDPLLAAAYCASIAIHEYHHIENHTTPALTPFEQVAREMQCDKFLHENHANIVALSDEAEKCSKTISRTYNRISMMPRP